MFKRLVFLLIGVLALGLSSLGWADVSVPTLFSNYMVLQRDILVPVWGTASVGETVTVTFNGQSRETTTNENGDWIVILGPMTTNSSPGVMEIKGNNTITITDVQVGEVWVGSGQSNMYNPLSGDCNASSVIANSGNFNIRLFNVGSGTPDGTIWEVCNPETSPSFSAVHFYFGRHLAQEFAKELKDVPIGLIHSAVSATAIERWATCAGSGGLYLDQIKPLQPYAIKGVTWYQGEWDSRSAKDAEKYYWQMPCLIDEWRTDWGQDPLNFPFYIVQMPKMGLSSIHIVRDAELQAALDDPKVEMIVTIDNQGSDVHPPCKEDFGIRLAKLARKFEYGPSSIIARSPFYNAAASYVAGDTIRVVFDDVADGLQSIGSSLSEWEIAGSDGSYVAAYAVIVGTDTVKVSSPSIPNPVSARYAFSPNPAANNLINSAGLPASPIREVTPGSGGPVCGDANCDPGEDQCNCASDCGAPPTTETNCSDGIDEDCDADTDCDDADCVDDPACPNCGDNTCDPPDEDQCNCSEDCGAAPTTETYCSDGADNDCDGAADCDDSDCASDPTCNCGAKKSPCTEDSECCSNWCHRGACK
jgi:sialate O-acetylesterase